MTSVAGAPETVDLGRRRSRVGAARDHWVTLLVLAIPAGFVMVAAWSRRWTSDDGFIDVRIVQQIFAGNGPVFNAGERVEAGTSPAWIGLLVLGRIVFFGLASEWVAVVFGIAATTAAIVLAEVAGLRLYRTTRVLPFGVVAFVVLPPVWDFATAGLETGLCFLWIASSQLALVLAARAPARIRTVLFAALVIGFGPLVRPDFVVMSIAYGVALLLVTRPHTPLRLFRIAAAALVLPTLYEVFRIAYYGALLPNSVIAKDPTSADWQQGWYYLKDFVSPYVLWVPVLLVALVFALALRTPLRDAADIVIAATPVVGGLVYTAFLLRGGGYHMHARLLLPALFAVLLPVAVVPRTRANIAFVLIVLVWAVVPMVVRGPPYDGIGPHRIANERTVWVRGGHDLVTLDDFRDQPQRGFFVGQRGVDTGDRAARLAKRDARVLIITIPLQVEVVVGPLDEEVPYDVVVAARAIGILSVAAGPDVYIEDLLGLADPLAARTNALARHWPGHNKELPIAWVIARFAGNAEVPEQVASPRDIEAAKAALRCKEISDLWRRASEPISFSTLVSNSIHAFSDYRVRVDRLPERAAETCR